MPPKFKYLILISILAFVRILPMLINSNYIPDTDNAFQIQSAQRLLEGKNLTYIALTDYIEDNPDISKPDYVYASGFPPGFALLIAGPMSVGIGLITIMILINFLVTLLVLYGWWLMGTHFNLKKWELISFILVVFLIILVRNLGVLTDLVAMGLMPMIFYLILNNKLTIKTLIFVGFLSAIIILFKYSALHIIAGISLYIIYSFRKEIKTLFISLIVYLILPIITFAGIAFTNNYYSSVTSITNFSLDTYIQSFITKFNFKWILDFLKSIYFGSFRMDEIVAYLLKMLGITAVNIPFYIVSSGLFALTVYFSIKLYKKQLVLRNLLFLELCMFLGAFLLLLFIAGRIASQVWHPLQETRYIMPIIPLLILSVFLFIKHFIEHIYLKNITFLTLAIVVFIFIIPRMIHDQRKINEFHNTKDSLNQIIGSVVSQFDDSTVPVVFSDNDLNSMLQIDNKYNAVRDVCVLNRPHHFSNPTLVFIIQDLRQMKTLSTQYETQTFLRDKYLSCQNDAISQTNCTMVKGYGFNLYYYYTPASQIQSQLK